MINNNNIQNDRNATIVEQHRAQIVEQQPDPLLPPTTSTAYPPPPLPLPLSIELNCELYAFLPLEKSINLLQLNRTLSQTCSHKVGQQYRNWQNFRDHQVAAIIEDYHPIEERMSALRAICQVEPPTPNNWAQQEQEGNMEMAADQLEMAKWVPPQAIRDAMGPGTRQKAMDHFLWCIVNVYTFLNRSKQRQQRALANFDYQFQSLLYPAKIECKPRLLLDPKWGTFSPLIKSRLTTAYHDRLDAYRREIGKIERIREEILHKLSWVVKLTDWDAKIRAYSRTLGRHWKEARAQEDAFDPNKWLEKLEEEEKEEGEEMPMEN